MQPLTPAARAWIVSEIERLLDEERRHRELTPWINVQLDTLLWFWSVDGMDGAAICRDAIPSGGGRGFGLASYTRAAREAYDRGEVKGVLKRDHVVPKKVVSDLLREDGARGNVERVLERYCFVTYLHADEHGALLKQTMPDGWDSGLLLERDPWARYRRLQEHIQAGLQVHSSAPLFRSPA